jgi:hypothetical protein
VEFKGKCDVVALDALNRGILAVKLFRIPVLCDVVFIGCLKVRAWPCSLKVVWTVSETHASDGAENRGPCKGSSFDDEE